MNGAMKKLIFLLLLLSGCTKEQIDQQMVQLTVEGQGVYLVTFGTSNHVTLKSEDKWSTTFSAFPGDTICLTVQTAESPATLYMGVEVQEGLLFCKSLFIEPQSVGTINHIVNP
jgi:hypothetical protein